MKLRALADQARKRLQWARRRLLGEHRLQRAAELGDIIIDGHAIELELLLGHHRHPGISKAGRLSVAGVCDGRKVKVYSAFSVEQVALRVALQQVSLAGLKLPKIIAFDENLVAEAWIEGVTVAQLGDRDRRWAEQQVEAFFEGNRTRTDLAAFAVQHQGAFRYLDDYLVRRLGPWSHVGIIRDFLIDWRRRYSEVGSQVPVLLSHPDLSRNNLIRENATGALVVVDNELLGAGRGWILDHHNSCLRGETLRLASDTKGVPPDFVRYTWQLRRLGSALDRGDLAEAVVIARGGRG